MSKQEKKKPEDKVKNQTTQKNSNNNNTNVTAKKVIKSPAPDKKIVDHKKDKTIKAPINDHKKTSSSNATELKELQDQVDKQREISEDKVQKGTNTRIDNTLVIRSNNELVSKENEPKSLKPINKDTSIYTKEKTKKASRNVGAIVGLSLVLLILVALLILSFIFAYINNKSNKIIQGVTIMGVDVSNLNKDEAIDKLNNEIDSRLAQNLVFTHHDEKYQIIPDTMEVKFNTEDVVNEAYQIGRNGNIFVQNLEIIKTKRNPRNISPKTTLNDEIFESIVSQMETNFADCLKESSYEIDGSKLIITKGQDGYLIDKDKLKDLFNDKFTSSSFSSDETIEVPVSLTKCDSIDIDKIHSEIYKAPVDATFTQEPFKITASETGLDFAISIDEAKALLKEDKDTYTIKLKTLYPKVSTNDIGKEAFPDLLGSYSTDYSSSNYNRSTNVELCSKFMNGKVLMPGDTISYNQTVGPRTPERGFKSAPIYANGTTAMGYGGGSCQVSSTIYNAVLRANLKIAERHNHMFVVGYVPIGLDATVAYGGPDFKFTNSRNYPIKVEVYTSGKKVYCNIYGHKEETEYEIKISSSRTGTIAPKTVYQTDSSLPSGTTKVISGGSNGATAISYRYLYINGSLVKTEVLANDKYSAHNRIVAKSSN